MRAEEQAARLLSALDQHGRCWLWRGRTNGRGYGRTRISGRDEYAHRLAYQWAFGAIPAGMEVLHACDTPACCNPAHLRVGTHRDNMQDMWAKGRRVIQRKSHCKHGHAFTPENTMIHGTEGYQRCRECMNAPRRRAEIGRPYKPRRKAA